MKLKIFFLITLTLILAACNLPAPATPVQSTPALGTAVAAIQTVSAINTETAAPAMSPTPIVFTPAPTATPSPYVQVVGKLVIKDGKAWIESYIWLCARDQNANVVENSLIKIEIKINTFPAWSSTLTHGDVVSPFLAHNPGEVVGVYVDGVEVLTSSTDGEFPIDVFVNR